MLYVKDQSSAQSSTPEANNNGTYELASCTMKSRYGLVTIETTYHSPHYLANGFYLSHICTKSNVDCCFISGRQSAINYYSMSPHITCRETDTY